MSLPTSFPHLKPEEKAILERYLRKYGPSDGWVIDYRFPAEDLTVPANLTDSEKTMLVALKQKRAEAVRESPTETVIVEVKPRVNYAALGQLLGYRELYLRLVKPGAHVRLVLVAEEDDPMIRPVLKQAGIETVLV